MSSLFGSAPSAAPQTSEEIKAAVVRQLQTEAAMTNARSLIGVRHHPWFLTTTS
jgi:import inner membrane translocase subunit TIM13